MIEGYHPRKTTSNDTRPTVRLSNQIIIDRSDHPNLLHHPRVATVTHPPTTKPSGGGNENSFVGIGPTRSQFPANGLTAGATGALPPPQPQSSNATSEAVKLNQAQIFIWFKL